MALAFLVRHSAFAAPGDDPMVLTPSVEFDKPSMPRVHDLAVCSVVWNVDVDPETAALADRIAALLAKHPLPFAIAIAIREYAGDPAQHTKLFIGWREAGCSRRVWQRLISSGALPAVQVSRAHLARTEDVIKCFERHKVVVRARGGGGRSVQPDGSETDKPGPDPADDAGFDPNAQLKQLERAGLLRHAKG